ncbi:hypothetical protein ccbrp13_30920 [Ktedonobacteria bacterium brp13]|nr:hypothetical protein ccbrp13_30920 [Ktedonobacteria bacterium brp13]
MDDSRVTRQQHLHLFWILLPGCVGVLLLLSVFIIPPITGNGTASASASTSTPSQVVNTVVVKPTPTPTPSPVTFNGSFGNDTLQGWSKVGNILAMHVNTNAKFAHSGSHSLQLIFQSQDAHKDFPYIYNQSPALSSLIKLHGGTLTAYIYTPAQTKYLSAQLFVSNNQHKQYVSGALHTLVARKWNRLSITIPSTVGKSFHWDRIGIQVHSNQDNVENTVYIDDIQVH